MLAPFSNKHVQVQTHAWNLSVPFWAWANRRRCMLYESNGHLEERLINVLNQGRFQLTKNSRLPKETDYSQMKNRAHMKVIVYYFLVNTTEAKG